MKIYIATDHAGFEMKNKLVDFLIARGDDVEDCGAATFDENDDYPDFIRECAKKVANDSDRDCRGVVLGGSGQGEAIVANRTPGIRAALYYGGPLDIVKLSREHNNANILSLGARFLSQEEAEKALELWLKTPFSGDEKHLRRISKID